MNIPKHPLLLPEKQFTTAEIYFIITVMPKIVNHQDRKRTFTTAAKDVIASKGLESARLIDVAKIAGATTGSLGHYFNDKEDLFDATLRQLIDDWEARLSSDGTLLDVLLQYLPMDHQSQKDLKVWVAFYTRALINKEAAAYIKAFHAEAKRKLSSYLQTYEGKQEQEAEEITIAIQTAVDGLAFRALGDLESWPASKQRAQLKATVDRLINTGASANSYRETAK